jgi:hypothetical protein
MVLVGNLEATQQQEARAIQRRERDKLLKKIWQRAVAAGDTLAAATCIQLGADLSWPILHGRDSMPALQVAAQRNDWAMVYLLLLFDAEQRSPVNALLQNWYSSLLYHKDYDVDVQGSGVIEVLTAAASASTQELRAYPPQLLTTKIEAIPPSLQWGASFALCAVMVDKEVRNASTSLEHTYTVLSSGSAACTPSAWRAAAAATNSTTTNLERLDTAAAAAELAVTTAESEIAAMQHWRAMEQQTPERATALHDIRLCAAIWAVVLLCLTWWTGLRRRRLYDLPCHIVPLPSHNCMRRVKLLRLSRILLLVEVSAFMAMLGLVRREANKIDCADPLIGCENEQFTFYITVLKPVLLLLVAQQALVWLISAVPWLLAQANITVLQTAAHFNMQRLAALVVTPHRAVADYSRTRPAVFGTVAAVLRLDRAAAAVVTVRNRAAAAVAAVYDDDLVAADSTVFEHDHAVTGATQQPVSTISQVLCNCEATLIDFSVVGTACGKGWDRAVVLRLLYTWMQSPQGQRADVIAKLAKSKDYTALRAIQRMYELCDGYSSDDSESDYDDSSSSGTLEPMWEAWLNGSMARMICTLCELHTVSDRCHLADETTVLTAVAAVKAAVERQYKQQHRELVMQIYAYERHTDGDAVQGDAADTEQGTINTEAEQQVVEQSARVDSSGHIDIQSGGAFADVQHGMAPNSSISSSAGTDISTAQSAERRAAAITTAADASTQTANGNADDNTAAEAAERAVATPVVAATTAAAEGASNVLATQQQARPLTALSEPDAAEKLTEVEAIVSEQCSQLALQDVQLRERDGTIQRLDEHMLLKRREHVTTETEILAARLELKGERIGHAATKRELAAVTQQLLHTCSRLDLHEANAADIANKLSDIEKREAQLTAAAAKAEGIKRELRTLRNRDAEHNAALQQCRDEAAAAAADAAKQLKAVTEQFDELEDRSVCVVCQHDPKQVLLQPCLHLCLCVKCSTSPKIVDCPNAELL